MRSLPLADVSGFMLASLSQPIETIVSQLRFRTDVMLRFESPRSADETIAF